MNKNEATVKNRQSRKRDLPCHLFLIGFMGCGKSSVSQRLKRKLSADRVEMDQAIAEREGMPITEIFARHGEDYFRDLETDFIRELKECPPSIVSCGGGAVIRPENVSMMKEMGKVVLLTASPESIYERVKRGKDRPILNGNMNIPYIRNLMEARRACYEDAADITISTDGKHLGQVCYEILDQLGLEQ